jgi:hypothetical protein
MKSASRFIVALAAVGLGLLGVSCKSTTLLSTTLVVTVDVDSALALDQVALSVAAPGKMAATRTVAASAPIVWTIKFPDSQGGLTVQVDAAGIKGSAPAVVTAKALVTVVPGQESAVILTLSARCAGVPCGDNQVCTDGSCGPIPGMPGGDASAGTPDGAAGRGGDAADDPGMGTRDAATDPGMGTRDAGPVPDAGTDTRDSTPDAAVCPSGQHNCGTCVADNSPDHCGSLCQPCLAPDGGSAVCSTGNTCDFTCGALKKCGSACITGCCDDRDCPTQTSTGKTGTCDLGSHTCNYDCPSDQKSCNGACIPKANCCTRADCPGACQTCGTSGRCQSVMGQDDSDKMLCPGTCDAQGSCRSKRGQTCTPASSNCVSGTTCSPDGFCCDRACTGPCEACDGTTPGTCMPVTGSAHIGHSGCAGTNGCGGSCTGAQNGQCTWSTGSCGQAACANQTNGSGQVTGTTFTATGSCNMGACAPPPATSCSGSLVCASTSACKTTCAADGDCSLGNYCAGNACAAKKTNGATCSAGRECSSGSCVDGVCCENSCPALCMACVSAKTGNTNGLCRAVKVATDPDNECATDTSNACGQDGTCDGAGGCRLQVQTTSCGGATCSGSTLTPAGKCNGSGTCIPAAGSSPCPGNFKCASTTACATTCTERSTNGCASGYECLNGACIAASVPCGASACAVANGGGACCWTDPSSTGTNAVSACLGPGATCTSLSFIPCNGKSDCPSGQLCCASGNGCSPSHWSVGCATTCPAASPYSFGYQVCDPSTPSECTTGSSCQASSCIPGISICM